MMLMNINENIPGFRIRPACLSISMSREKYFLSAIWVEHVIFVSPLGRACSPFISSRLTPEKEADF